MTTSEALLSFTAAAGLLTLTPGLDTALVLRTAAVEGGRRALLAGIGVCLGCLVWGLAVSVGLGGLLAVSATHRATLPLLETMLGYVVVLLPLLFLDTRFLK